MMTMIMLTMMMMIMIMIMDCRLRKCLEMGMRGDCK